MKKELCFWMPVMALALASCGEKKSDPATGSTDPKTPQTYVLYDDDFTPPTGTKVVERMDMRMRDAAVEVTAFGQKMKGVMNSEEVHETTTDYLGKDKMRLTTSAQTGSNRMVMDGEAAPDDWEASPLLQVPVIATKQDGEWQVRLEEGEADEAQQEELKELLRELEVNPDRKMYGTEPRRVGESWTVDGEGLEFFGEMGESEGEVTLTLDKVEEHQGQLCAFLSGRMEISGTPPDLEEGMKGRLTLKADFEVIRSLPGQVDLKGDIKGTAEMNMTWPAGKMSMSGPIEVKVTTTVE